MARNKYVTKGCLLVTHADSKPFSIRNSIFSQKSKHPKQTLEVVGKQAISYKDWITSMRDKKSKPRYLSVPMKWMKLIARLIKPFNPQLISLDNLTMLEQNNIGSYKKLKLFLENKNDIPDS